MLRSFPVPGGLLGGCKFLNFSVAIFVVGVGVDQNGAPDTIHFHSTLFPTQYLKSKAKPTMGRNGDGRMFDRTSGVCSEIDNGSAFPPKQTDLC